MIDYNKHSKIKIDDIQSRFISLLSKMIDLKAKNACIEILSLMQVRQISAIKLFKRDRKSKKG